ncbi:HVO_0234 family beta-propeller protein [Halorussus ruber]|uniref:HVO_0234 family beta-propeller protein n=1 Tax=Halorussus ruber TaxID=1126238 RepID=UPI0010930D53|nr:hypothetical protein [Halorussus ruber]
MGISIDEKRVYDASEGPTPVYVVGDLGVTRVDTSDDLVGEFGLARRCSARDAAGRDGRLAVATDEDVLVGVFGKSAPDENADEANGEGDEEVEFEALGVGPATAVGLGDARGGESGELLVAREGGTLLRGNATVGEETDSDWTDLGEVDDVRAIDGDFVATDSGVYQATDGGLKHVGLDGVRDVSTDGVPLAATEEGLYKLGNGWMDELSGEFSAVDAAAADAGLLGWAHAASEEGLFAHDEDEWREVELPVEGEIVALDHGEEGAYAVTEDGTFLLSVGDGWNHQILGIRGVRAVAAP